MKSERRHDLNENELAQELGKAGEFIKNNLQQLAMGFIFVVLVIFAAVSYTNSHRLKLENEWNTYISLSQQNNELSTVANDLLDLAASSSQESLVAYAYLAGGEKLMVEASLKWAELSSEDRDKLLARAEDAFNKVVSSFANNAQAAAKAKLDLGRLAELKGDFKSAAEKYQALAQLSDDVAIIRDQAVSRLAVANNPPAAVELADKPAEPVAEEAETASEGDVAGAADGEAATTDAEPAAE